MLYSFAFFVAVRSFRMFETPEIDSWDDFTSIYVVLKFSEACFFPKLDHLEVDDEKFISISVKLHTVLVLEACTIVTQNQEPR